MTYAAINFADKLARFSDHWSPKIIAQPSAAAECRMMLVEPAGTVNTGGVTSELTAQDGVWV